MIIGVPVEVKIKEFRVGLTPASVRELTNFHHQVIVQTGLGSGIGFKDQDYIDAGAYVVDTAQEVYAQAEMIVKVKEPQPAEFTLLHENQILFTYLHLAPDPEQAEALIKSGCIAIAYETVTSIHGDLPLLSPMSQVAGRLSIQAGAHCLEKSQGGSGILLGGVPGVPAGNVVVIGGGVVGTNAIRIAMGMEAKVTVLDKSLHRLQQLDFQFGGRLTTAYASAANIEQFVTDADLVVGAVLTAGEAAPKLVTREMLTRMRPGSVIVDVAIDQGGCIETSRPTTHDIPTYLVENIVHYCVTNMPGGVPRTSTFALNNATLPFVLELANKGYRKALLDNIHLRNGLNVCNGHITHQGVAKDLNKEYRPTLDFLQ
jgi:alanine dehydrogenase